MPNIKKRDVCITFFLKVEYQYYKRSGGNNLKWKGKKKGSLKHSFNSHATNLQ